MVAEVKRSNRTHLTSRMVVGASLRKTVQILLGILVSVVGVVGLASNDQSIALDVAYGGASARR